MGNFDHSLKFLGTNLYTVYYTYKIYELKQDITNLIMNVIDTVADLPKEYQKSSFEVLLNYFLIQSQLPLNTRTKKQTTQKRSEADTLQRILHSEYDWAATGIRQLKGVMQYIKILDVARQDFNIDKLSVSDIKIILEQKFRQKKSTNTIAMALIRSVGLYVDRIKNKEYEYGITAAGKKKLSDLEETKNEN